jgi:pimeloyl-ACP methyl ester carboxylesterase
MALLSATGVSVLNSSARALSAAPPLVPVHSLGSTGAMSWASVADSPRAAGCRVTTPDLPGHRTAIDTPFTWEHARAIVRVAGERYALTPVGQTAFFCDATQTALTMLRGDGNATPALPERLSLVPTRGEDPR